MRTQSQILTVLHFTTFQSGQPLLNEWLCELQRLEHKPPVDFDLSIGAGSQDLLTKVIATTNAIFAELY